MSGYNHRSAALSRKNKAARNEGDSFEKMITDACAELLVEQHENAFSEDAG